MKFSCSCRNPPFLSRPRSRSRSLPRYAAAAGGGIRVVSPGLVHRVVLRTTLLLLLSMTRVVTINTGAGRGGGGGGGTVAVAVGESEGARGE